MKKGKELPSISDTSPTDAVDSDSITTYRVGLNYHISCRLERNDLTMGAAYNTIVYVRVSEGEETRSWTVLGALQSSLTPNGESMKTFNTSKVRAKEVGTDFSSVSTYQEALANTDLGEGVVSTRMGKGSSMKVTHYEIINGKRYKVLTVG